MGSYSAFLQKFHSQFPIVLDYSNKIYKITTQKAILYFHNVVHIYYGLHKLLHIYYNERYISLFSMP